MCNPDATTMIVASFPSSSSQRDSAEEPPRFNESLRSKRRMRHYALPNGRIINATVRADLYDRRMRVATDKRISRFTVRHSATTSTWPCGWSSSKSKSTMQHLDLDRRKKGWSLLARSGGQAPLSNYQIRRYQIYSWETLKKVGFEPTSPRLAHECTYHWAMAVGTQIFEQNGYLFYHTNC